MKIDLLKEAIADADAIKKLAIENAKASLNEAFDSKIKSMLSARLQEEAEEEGQEEEEDDRNSKDEAKHEEGEEGETDESFDLDEILAEMEADEDDMKSTYEGKDEDEDDEEPEVKEPEEEEPKEDDEESMDEELDLEALLAEISGDDEGMANLEEEEDENESYGGDEENEAYKQEDELDEAEGDATATAKAIAAIKKALRSLEAPEAPKAEPKAEPKAKDESVELQEIKRQAKQLALKVNETNLINAKLLYLNKILHNNNLNEGQKVKVLSAFDRATSVKEAKIVYESLSEAFSVKTTKTKTNLKESFGFASKAAGTSTKREILTEADQQVSRWQKLAGIIK